MESLVNYESDDENGDYNDSGKNDTRNRQRLQEDANYDEIGMDESSEESNNNQAEGHFSSDGKEKEEEGNNYQSVDSRNNEERNYRRYSSDLDKDSNSKSEDGSSQNNFDHLNESHDNFTNSEHFKGFNSKKSEDTHRRHSSDMEMDDGEDDLDNYNVEESKTSETTADFRQRFAHKNINFTKGKSLGEESGKKMDENFLGSGAKGKVNSDWANSKDFQSEKESNYEESQNRDEKMRSRDKGKDLEDRRKGDYRRRDERDKKRDDDRYRESDRDRRNDKYREDRERRRTPDRHGRKRSHSPDRRDRDRDYDRDRDRDRERDRDRDRERDRDRDRDRDRERERRSPKYPRKGSRSPERSDRYWKTRKLEKKAAVLNKLGIELKTDVTGNMTPRQLLGEQLKAQIQEVEAKTGVTLPTYYNPGVMNPLKYAQQIQKRKLLWGNKSNEAKGNEGTSQGTSTVKQWEAATFKGDNDGKMTEKFKRLMGIKGDTSTATSSGTKPPETKEIIQKQEEMFSNMEAQYQVARMATHTHRGVGLGFGTFQVPPR